MLSQTFTYDPFGNIKKGGSPTYSASYQTATNQVSSGISPSPTYDANGNQKNLTATGESISWNALNQPITMNGVTATYDALGRMVETGSGSSYQQFVFGPSGDLLAIYNAGTTTLVKGTVPLPGGDTAIYNSGGLSYLRHTDWLGSSRLATTWAHAVYSKEAYAPFGETYNEAGTADRSFTGQDQDVVTGSGGTGAYDFLFRKHDPSAGRWLNPDPLGWSAVDQTNPQSLNRYAYALNNPLALVDPLGLDSGCGSIYDQGGNPIGTQTTSPGGVPCDPPPMGCEYVVNAQGEFLGMSCNGGPSAWIPSDMGEMQMIQQSGSGGTPWYKNSCVTGVLAQNAVSLGVDLLGTLPIPEAGGITRLVGQELGVAKIGTIYRGAVADAQGSMALNGLRNTVSAGVLGGNASDTSGLGLASTAAGGAALTVGYFIPVLGNILSGAQLLIDGYHTYKTIGAQCYGHS